MKKPIKILIIPLLCCTTLFAQPDIHWIHIYGWEDRLDHFWDVYLTAEGNYACCGSSQYHNNQDGWLLLADDGGGQIFSRRYDAGHDENFASLIETDDGGFFLGGHLYTQEVRVYVFAVLTDEEGEELWNRSIAVGDDNPYSWCKAVIEAKSDEYLMTGYTHPDPNSALTDGFLLALNNEGELLWEQTYHVARTQKLYAMREVDGGYLLAGSISHVDRRADFWLVRTDEVGDMIWSREFGEGGVREKCYSLISCREGGWAMAGNGPHMVIARLNREAQLDWMIHYERDESYPTRCIVQTPDDGFALVGWMFDVNDQNHDNVSLTIKVDREGNEMWERLDNFDMPGAGFSATVISPDRSIVAAGTIVTEERHQEYQGLLVKLFPEFSPPEIVEYTPEELDLTVLLGDTVTFSVRAEDIQDDSLLYVWTFENEEVSTDTAVSIPFPELGNFNVKCIVSDGELADSIQWRVHVVEFYISGFAPDTLDLIVRRNSSVDFSLEVRALEDIEVEYFWTLVGRGQRREVGNEDSITVLFDLTGDFRLTGLVWREGAADGVEWSVHVRSAVWWWLPTELEQSIPVNTLMEFIIFPFNPESDSLSYRWWLNDDPLDVDTTADLVEVEFSELGHQTLVSIVHDGCEADTITWEIDVFDPRSVTDDQADLLPNCVSLSTPSPNPFNAMTRIGYAVPEAGYVSLAVYGISGRLVSTLVDGHVQAGRYTCTFDAGDLPAGLYFIRLEAGGNPLMRKAVVVK